MLGKILARLRFLRFHNLHRKSAARIRRWQEKRLRAMIAHVQKNVPLYQELHKGVDPSVIREPSLKNIHEFPVVTKAHIIGHPVEYYTDNSQRADGAWLKTSGTSGVPFTVLERKDLAKPYYGESIIYRAFTSSAPWKFIDKPRIARIMTKSPPQKNRLFLTITDHRIHAMKTVERLMAFKPEILESYASILYDTARLVERERLPLRIPVVVSGGERLTKGLRNYLERVFGAEVYNRYGMEEFTVVATECERHDGMHTICESLIVEIVDREGAPVPEGQFGRIVVTDLYNFAMPYIRYDTGDHGRITWEPCACGIKAPRIWLEGRYTAWLTFKGRRINHLEYDLALDMFMNAIVQYQVVKKSETEAIVMIIPGTAYGPDIEKEIIANISDLIGDGVTVTVQCVERLPSVPRGKSLIVSDLTRSA